MSPRRALVTATLAAALLLPAGIAQAQSQLTPVIVTMVPQQSVVPVKGSDGRFHVLYEFVLTNTTNGSARLGPVRMIDAASGRTVRRLSVREMIDTGALHRLDRGPGKRAVLPEGTSRLLTLDASFARRSAIPRVMTQRFRVSATNPLNGQREDFAYRAGDVRLSRKRPPVLAPPLTGTGWIASDGCCGPSGHVNAMLGIDGRLQATERFAIDWLRVDDQGRMFDGDPKDPRNWFSYGEPIYAMGDGVVIEVQDGQPDSTPGTMPRDLSFDEVPGNLVAIRGRGGLTQVYAHIAPGTVAVKKGDRVRTGTLLGELGNTGASLAPHLHMHVVDGTDAKGSDGYPFVLDRFDLAGQASVDQLVAAISGEPGFPARSELRPRPHRDELPLGFSIVDFPAKAP